MELFIIPFILIFIAIEYLASTFKPQKLFFFDHSISNIGIGIAERMCDLLLTGSFYAAFNWVYNHAAITHIPSNWVTWVVLLLFTDFIWYWYHRLGHMVNLFWGAHIVHHQSPDFNYTTAVRITIIQSGVRNLFWCILPVMGFTPEMTTVVLLFHGGYSFFTHTQTIGRLGFLEKILITPTHHGVHHASNDVYLDKNFGDVFVFWDKLFGTFQEKTEQPTYGLTHPLNSFSFLWQYFHFYLELWTTCRRTMGLMNKIRILLGSPSRIHPGIRTELEQKLLKRQTHPDTVYRFKNYIILQQFSNLLLLLLLIGAYKQLNAAAIGAICTWILLTLINCGAIQEKRKWTHYPEAIRLFWLIVCLSYYAGSFFLFGSLTFLYVLIILLFPVQKWYHHFMFTRNITCDTPV